MNAARQKPRPTAAQVAFLREEREAIAAARRAERTLAFGDRGPTVTERPWRGMAIGVRKLGEARKPNDPPVLFRPTPATHDARSRRFDADVRRDRRKAARARRKAFGVSRGRGSQAVHRARRDAAGGGR